MHTTAFRKDREIKILRYNASTDTLTEHVDEDDSRPPQLGIHYHVGFENALYIDDFEGIVADYRGNVQMAIAAITCIIGMPRQANLGLRG